MRRLLVVSFVLAAGFLAALIPLGGMLTRAVTIDVSGSLNWSVQYLVDQSRTVGGKSQFDAPRDNRGLALSPDGQFLYAGYNNPSSNDPGEHIMQVRKIDTTVADFDNATVAILEGLRGKAIATDDVGRVYLAEGTTIEIYDGNLSTSLFTISGLTLTEGVAVTRESGNLALYATDRTNKTLTRWTVQEGGGGTVTGVTKEGLDGDGEIIVTGASSLRGVEVDPSGRIWMADISANTVFRVNNDGTGLTSVSVTKAMDIAFDDTQAFVTQYTTRTITVLQQSDMSTVSTLTPPWATLKLDPDGQSAGGALSGIVMGPGSFLYVANETGQTENEKSTYGRCDDQSDNPGGPCTFTDLTHDDNDPILKVTGTLMLPPEADLKIVSQEILAENCVDPAPTDIDVSSDVPICVKKVLHNNGPQAPVDVDIAKTATAPAGCTITPASDTDQVTLEVSVDVAHMELFTIHCSEPSLHGPFTIENEITPSDPGITDPDLANNSATSELTVAAWAVADAAIVDQWVESCDDLNHNAICDAGEPPLPAPTEIPVSEDVPIVVMKTIHNFGTYGPVDLQTVKTPTAPPDCSIAPFQHVEQIFDVPVSVDVTHVEPFTIHCSAPSEHTFTFDNVISFKEPHLTDPDPSDNTAHTEWTVAATTSADLEVVAQRTVVWPANIDVSQDVLVTLETDIRNNGPFGPVEAEFEGWLVPPTPCTALPALLSQQVTLDAGEMQTIEQEFTIHCSEKCLRTFTFWNRITAKDPHIVDPDPTDNEKSRLLPSIESWALGDVEIVSQSFVSPPSRIDVSTSVDVTLRKTLHNIGPYGPVTVSISPSVTAPPDCTAVPKPGNPTSATLPTSTNVVVDEVWTIHCSNQSSHSFSFGDSIAPTTIHVKDPNLGNNSATTNLTVAAYKYTDVEIVSQSLVSPPSEIEVSESVPVTLHKVLHNNGGFGPVQVSITAQAVAPSGCTATPSPGNLTSTTLPVSTDVLVDEVWTLHCSEPSTHSFTFNDTIAITTPHVDDSAPGNNTASTPLSVDVIAEADVEIASQSFVSPPAHINVSESVPVTLRKVLHNDGPYSGGPVTVTIAKTATAPADCTIDPATHSEQVVVPYNVDVTVDETFTIHCSQPTFHTFTVENEVSEPKEPHIIDPDLANNDASTDLTVEVGGLSDVKVADQYVQNMPAEIPVSSDVSIVLVKVLHNNGPYGPVHAETVTDVTVPPDCTVSPNPHIQRFWDVPVSVDIPHWEPFVIHCSEPSEHTFVFDDSVTLTDPNATDPVLSNNSQVTEITVPVVAEADVKITSVGFVNPPNMLPLGQEMDVTLRKHVHNNGPWTPVNIAIDATAAAPTGCTIVPKSVPTSLTNVPVSVDQIVDEIWTIQCTETGLKTFVFDNSLDVATPHVSDPELSNNSRHKLLSVEDDATAELDYDLDGLCDACEVAAGTSITKADTDGDGVSDGLLDPDGDGPIAAGADNCPLVKNASQGDFDGDGIGDACETDDSDVDGFSDAVELHVGTDFLAACIGEPPHDAWPLDINVDGRVTVVGDVLAYVGRIGATAGPPASANWNQRLDLNADDSISVVGDVLKFAGKIGMTCS